jgi:hypothetical protein
MFADTTQDKHPASCFSHPLNTTCNGEHFAILYEIIVGFIPLLSPYNGNGPCTECDKEHENTKVHIYSYLNLHITMDTIKENVERNMV